MTLLPDTLSSAATETLGRAAASRTESTLKGQGGAGAKEPANAFHTLLNDTAPAEDRTASAEPVLSESESADSADKSHEPSAPEEAPDTPVDISAWLPAALPVALPAAPPAGQAVPETVDAQDGNAALPVPTCLPLTGAPLTPSDALPSQTPIPPDLPPALAAAMPCVSSDTPDTPLPNPAVAEAALTAATPVVPNLPPLPVLLPEPVSAAPPEPLPNLYRPDFEQRIATQILWLAERTLSHAHIRIAPPHLGALEVKLHLHENRLHATFYSAQAEVRQRLQDSLPALHRRLDEHGLQLAQADVGQRAPEQDSAATGAFAWSEDPAFVPSGGAPEATPDVSGQAAAGGQAHQEYALFGLLDTWA